MMMAERQRQKKKKKVNDLHELQMTLRFLA